jgi:hypothetical protein
LRLRRGAASLGSGHVPPSPLAPASAPDDVTRTVGAARPRRSFKAAAKTCAGLGGRSGQVNTVRQLNGRSKRPASIAGVLA